MASDRPTSDKLRCELHWPRVKPGGSPTPGLGTGVANQQYTALTRHHGKRWRRWRAEGGAPQNTQTRPDQPCASIHFFMPPASGPQNDLASPIRICLIEGPAQDCISTDHFFPSGDPQIHTKLPGKAEREGQHTHTSASMKMAKNLLPLRIRARLSITLLPWS